MINPLGDGVAVATCECGKMVLEYDYHANTITIQGGILSGAFCQHVKCFGCDDKVRIGPNITYKGYKAPNPYGGTKLAPKVTPSKVTTPKVANFKEEQVDWVNDPELDKLLNDELMDE